jgi:hypothetical protein
LFWKVVIFVVDHHSTGVITKNKDKKAAALQSENDALTRNLELVTQEHREQVSIPLPIVIMYIKNNNINNLKLYSKTPQCK